jgi:PKD repeat protein
MSGTGNSLVLINGQQGYDVLIWDEGGGSNVMVNLGTTYGTVNVYDPIQGSNAIQMLTNTGQVSVQLGTDPIIVTATSP